MKTKEIHHNLACTTANAKENSSGRKSVSDSKMDVFIEMKTVRKVT